MRAFFVDPIGPQAAPAESVLGVNRAVALSWIGLASAALSWLVLRPDLWDYGLFAAAALGSALFVLAKPTASFLVWFALAPVVFKYFTLKLGDGLPNLTVDRVAVFATVLALFLQGVLRTRRLAAPGPTEALMALFSLGALLSLLLKGGSQVNVYFQKSQVANDFYLFVQAYGIPFLMFFLGKNLFHSKRQVGVLVNVAWGLGTYLATLGLLQVMVDPRLLVPETQEGIHYGRAVGPFGNATEFGAVVTICFLLTLYRTLHDRVVLRRGLALVSLAVMGVSVVLTYTRAVWLGLALALAVVQFSHRKLRPVFAGIVLCGALGLWAAANLGSGTTMLARRTTDLGPVYGRIVLLATGLKSVADSPLAGYGFSRYAFQEAKDVHLGTLGSVSAKHGAGLYAVHNEFLNVGIMLGVPGLAVYALVLATAGLSAVRVHRSRDGTDTPAGLALFVLAALALYLFESAFVDLMPMSYLSGFVYLLLGIVDARRRGAEVTV